MSQEQGICESNVDHKGESSCKCGTTENWMSLHPRARSHKSQSSNTCARREAEYLRLYEDRIAALNAKERDIKMHRLIIESYVQSTKHFLPTDVYNDWFGEAGLLQLPGTARSVRTNKGSSSATNPSPEASQHVRPNTDSAGNSIVKYFCKGCRETIKANPTTRIAFLGDGNLVNGIMNNIIIAKVICRGCQANKTMDLANKHMLCFNCDLKEES